MPNEVCGQLCDSCTLADSWRGAFDLSTSHDPVADKPTRR
jgi:hypothetical protein